MNSLKLFWFFLLTSLSSLESTIIHYDCVAAALWRHFCAETLFWIWEITHLDGFLIHSLAVWWNYPNSSESASTHLYLTHMLRITLIRSKRVRYNICTASFKLSNISWKQCKYTCWRIEDSSRCIWWNDPNSSGSASTRKYVTHNARKVLIRSKRVRYELCTARSQTLLKITLGIF